MVQSKRKNEKDIRTVRESGVVIYNLVGTLCYGGMLEVTGDRSGVRWGWLDQEQANGVRGDKGLVFKRPEIHCVALGFQRIVGNIDCLGITWTLVEVENQLC